MDKKLRETFNFGVEIMNSKREVKKKLGHVVQNSCLPFHVNVMLNLFCMFPRKNTAVLQSNSLDETLVGNETFVY